MPFYRHMGITLTKLGLGSSEIKVNVTKGLTQSAGFAHGGVAASLVDSAVGLALCTLLRSRESITTIELKVNFVAPARPGVLKAKGRIIQRGKRIAVGESEVKDRRGRYIAKGLVTYMILKDRERPNTGAS
jgi:acyl-CoA thioesterase